MCPIRPEDPPSKSPAAISATPAKTNLIYLPIGDHGYTHKGKRERVKHEHSVGYGTEEFDIIDELTVNRDQYSVGPEDKCYNLSMLDFPSLCTIAVNGIKARMGLTSVRIGVHTIISCCIANAIAIVDARNDTRRTLESRERFDLSNPDADGYIITQLNKWFDQFAGEIVFSGERQNIKLPLGVGSSLSELAKGLGLSNPTMAVVCSMITLCTQPSVNRHHRAAMSGHVEDFYRTVQVRIDGIDALMERFGLS
jgi:hypothetical protein